MAVHERAGERVQLGDVAAAERDHDVAGEVVAGGGPPVGEQPRLRRERCLGGDEAAFAFGEGEVVAAEAVADRLERVALVGVVLAAVLAELDRAVAFDDAGEEAAGADRGQLGGIADQDDLPLRLLDAFEQRREDARLGHPGLVDDDEAALGQLAAGGGGGAWSTGCRSRPASFSAAMPGGCGAEHRDAGGAEGVGDGAGGGGLACAGEPDDADDAVRAGGDRAQHRRCSADSVGISCGAWPRRARRARWGRRRRCPRSTSASAARSAAISSRVE